MNPMSKQGPETPVSLFIFNRPDCTEKVFEQIRSRQPSRLLIVADGPRSDHPEDIEKCVRTRAILEKVDWPCELLVNLSDRNLGCAKRISSGLDWVFQHVDEAIILEDDCLPHPTFFRYCDELLDRYRMDERVMHISGDNFQFGRKRGEASYYFSVFPHVWGWATWRRAWRHFEGVMDNWLEISRGNYLARVLPERSALNYWTKIFQAVYCGSVNSWAYPWTLACWLQGALSLLPNCNLVSNIGFGSNATHTRGVNEYSNLPTESLPFPLVHPRFIMRDFEADQFTQRTHFCAPSLISKVRGKLRAILRILEKSK
jgi:hypothetical protein